MSGKQAAEPLRVLWIGSKLNWDGGIGRVLAGASQALAARGHEVHVAGAAKDGAPPPLRGVTVHPWRPRRWKLRYLPELLSLQRALRPQVVHFHAAKAHGELIAPLRALRAGPGAPAIFVTSHSGTRTDYPKWRTRLGIRRADAVVCPSRWSASKIAAGGAREADTFWVYAGIELPERVLDELREKVVLTLGRLVKLKGVALLIEAFDRAAAKRPDWRLQIAGDGPELGALRAQAAECEARERIEFLGLVTGAAKREALERASLGVAPSLRESFGGALLELEAHGLACIATTAGGMPELSDEGRATRQVPPGDIDALTNALGDLMDDERLRSSLAECGRRVAEQMTWPAAARRYEEIYARYLA